METAERPCFIHIGTHKTGTTSIQVFLASNRDRLFANGAVCPNAGTEGDAGVVAHHALARELHGTARPGEVGSLESLADELRRSDARTACVTSEDLCFLWDNPASLIRLRDAVIAAGFLPRIVVYLRPQASYCTAVYAENVRHGYRASFATYLKDVLGAGQYRWDTGSGPPFDYPRLLDPFATVFGRQSLIVRRYRAGAPDDSLVESFARLLLPADIDFRQFVMPAMRYNGSLDFAGVLAQLGTDVPIAHRLRFTPLDVAQTLRVGLRFRASNTLLAALYGVRLPAFEPTDLALGLPVRRTRIKTQALACARRALADYAPSEALTGAPTARSESLRC